MNGHGPLDLCMQRPHGRGRACFFARVARRSILTRNEFYAQDMQMLRDLGYDVHVATRARDIQPADLYLVWWWSYAFIPLLHPFRRGRPVIITGVLNDIPVHTRPLHERMLMRYALRAAAHNALTSMHEHAYVLANEPTAGASSYIPLAVDTDRYTLRDPGQPSPMVFAVATMCGPNSFRKSIPELIKAAAIVGRRHPGVRFVIAGEFDDEPRRWARQAGADNLQLVGQISTADKIGLMQSCAVYAQPSRYRGLAGAIAEALACGAPVVTSHVGHVPTVVGNSARFVDGESPLSIADGICDVLEHQDYFSRLAVEGAAHIRRSFAPARRRDLFRKLIDDLDARGADAVCHH